MPKRDDRSKQHGNSDQVSRAFGGWLDGGGGGEGHHSRGTLPEDTFEGTSGILFEQAMAQTRMAICLSDPHADDQPIVFANRAFREMTGYPEHEIVGQNCRFLQGPDTDPENVARIREALASEEVIVVELLNYRKDGTPFWNALHIGPIYNQDGKLIYFFGSQWDVTDVHAARTDEQHAKLMSRELSHRVKNMFAVIGGIVTVTGRTRGIKQEAREINERIQALGRAYETTLDDASRGSINVSEAIRAVLYPYDPEGDRIAIHASDTRAAPSAVSSLGLTLHELATNAVKHGSLSVEGGTVNVSVHGPEEGGSAGGSDDRSDADEREEGRAEEPLRVRWIERGGPSVTPPDGTCGTGMGIVDALLAAAGGDLARDWRPDGLDATIRLPDYRS